MKILQNLRFHHVACLTENIQDSIHIYSGILGLKKASEIFTVSTQQVKVCFIEMAPDVYLELVEPSGVNQALTKILRSKNPYYHTGYLVENISLVIEQLQREGFYLVNRFLSEAFNNKECAFLYTSEMHLIELIEK